MSGDEGAGVEDLNGSDLETFKAFVEGGFLLNRAEERLAADEYASPEERQLDAVLVALPRLFNAVADALTDAVTQQAEELHTIEDEPDNVGRRHPELTNIPAASFWRRDAAPHGLME
ncbi:hypothetical protein [Streptomyces antarcticus]|uniref:hypothetical protein n=1 Tax=Streptomyces antarcticus TaxID=2996458 RepID=UPI0022711B97|nr:MULTISPECIES: hypothetical protein [unclassified Streptomyces]MCY0941934.1 hypothetical protein [Streptomyces sp. H34-AA3]MCZ4082794.1 hypothetical protein [Streptomyces sp. H34-S5]